MSSSALQLEKFLIPLEEIISATQNFSPESRIGKGGFGVVYKGILSERWENRTAAIKCRSPDSFQGKHEFENELQMVSKFHHQNIIPFIGYCDQGNNMIIIYEYAVNGSLDDHLQDTDRRCSLTWARRLKICIGATRGLKYLHSGLGDDHRVVHRDVKSGNILLDEKMEAKICDFGLSRSAPRNKQHTEVHTRVAGTRFYLDPLYHESEILRKESDVYSLGVVLFEMMIGMLAYDRRSIGGGEPQTLLNLVRRHKDVELDEIIDLHISNEIDSRSLSTFKEIAYKCISYQLKERPIVDTIIDEIEKALDFQERFESAGREQPLQPLVHGQRNEVHSPLSAGILIDGGNTEVFKSVDWEHLLPRNYKEIIQRSDQPLAHREKHEVYSLLSAGILIDGGNKWFSLCQLNRKNCLMISAKELFDGNDEYLEGWESFPKLRFSNVASFQSPRLRSTTADCVHEKEMHVIAPMLSLETTYAVFLNCKYKGNQYKAHTKSSPPDIYFVLRYGNDYLFPCSAEWKDEEWMEVELFQFTNHMEVANFQLKLIWKNKFYHDGLFVEGIGFRPIDMDTNEEYETKVEQPIEFESDMDWEKKLPSDYEEIISRSTNVLHYTTKKELYSLLVTGIFIDDNSMWFSLRASDGKKCVMLSAMSLSVKNVDGMKNKIQHSKSRFSTTLVVNKFSSLEIRGKIKVDVLLSKTPYAAWLVYEGSLQGTNIAFVTLGNQENKTRHVYLCSSSNHVLEQNDPKYPEGTYSINSYNLKLDRRPRIRKDDLYEVELFPFSIDVDAHYEVEVGLHVNVHKHIEDITIHGIEFRPQ